MVLFFFPRKFIFPPQPFFYPQMTESEKIVLVSCIVDFDEMQI